jgi:hypothetical protein
MSPHQVRRRGRAALFAYKILTQPLIRLRVGSERDRQSPAFLPVFLCLRPQEGVALRSRNDGSSVFRK